MKVGILTFHEGLNHGAYLQAYCTMLTVREMGHDPVIINYKNREHWLKEDVRPWLAYRRPVRFLDHWRKRKAFKKDHKAMNLTSFTKNPDEVRSWHFDAVVVGSDVVWDTNIFGFDSLYFGDLNAERRVAYAASCGSDDFSGEVCPEIQKQLRVFDHISVRDENTENFVENATGQRPVRVMDPVFLPENIDEFCQKDLSSRESFVLVYGGHYSAEDGAFVRDLANKRGLKVISVGARNVWADECLLSVGPLQILSYFKRASFVFSSTFHGCIFALRSQKDFGVLLHGTINNKVTSLLEYIGHPARGASRLAEIGPAMDEPLDYGPINKVLNEGRRSSLEFLKGALS